MAQVQAQAWTAPLYWIAPGDPRCPHAEWQMFGLQGVQPLDPQAQITHLSFSEAAAFAEWAGPVCRPSLNGSTPWQAPWLACPRWPTCWAQLGNGRALPTQPYRNFFPPATQW